MSILINYYIIYYYMEKNIKSVTIYSNKKGRGIKKTFNLNRYSDKFVEKLINEFIQKIENENIEYIINRNENKKINDKIENENKKIENENKKINDKIENEPIEIKNNELPKIKMNEIMKKITDDKSASNICIFGCSKCGKSTLLIEMILQWIKLNNNLIVICFFGNLNIHTYDELIDNKKIVIFNGLKPSLIYTLWLINSVLIDKKYEFLIIIDDIIQARNIEILNNLAMSYRNQRLNSIFSLQSCMLINPSARNNATLYIYFKNKQNEVKKILDHFLNSNPHFINKKNKNKISEYNKLTENHDFICNFPLDNEILLIGNSKL